MQIQLQSLERQQQHTEQLQQGAPPQAAPPQQHQLPGPGPSISFSPEAEPSPEAETSRKHKRGPVWKRKHLVIEQINELIDELDEIDGNIALQVPEEPTSAFLSCVSHEDAAEMVLYAQSVAMQAFPSTAGSVMFTSVHKQEQLPRRCSTGQEAFDPCGH